MRNSPVYYGWYVLAASAVSEMLVQGATIYASGLFVLPLQAEFHISRAAANLPVLILFAGAMLIAPVVGRALDTRPIRLVMLAGRVLLGLSFGGIAATHSLADDGRSFCLLPAADRLHGRWAAEHLHIGVALVLPPPGTGAGHRRRRHLGRRLHGRAAAQHCDPALWLARGAFL